MSRYLTWRMVRRSIGLFALGLWLLAGSGPWNPDVRAETSGDQCVACHGDPNTQARSRKLRNYFQDWERSIHRQAEVTCVDCHGGDATKTSRGAAHKGAALNGRGGDNGLGHLQIPELCAECHAGVYEQYRKSAHYRALMARKEEQRAPNCVTCHGSVNTFVLTVNTVRQACGECHGPGDTYERVPEQAERVLSTLLTIWRYAGYLAQGSESSATVASIRDLDRRVRELNQAWHSFDIDAVERRAEALLAEVQAESHRVIRVQDSMRRRHRSSGR